MLTLLKAVSSKKWS